MPKSNGNGGAKILEFKQRLKPKSNRSKLLSVLVRSKSPLPSHILAKKVYGNARRTAPLALVALGLNARLRAERVGAKLVKERRNGEVLYSINHR